MKGKNILVAPLNWGLGHATRIIPIIRILSESGAKVFVSGSKEQIRLLTVEFNNLQIVSLPYLKIKLNKNKSQILFLLLQTPWFIHYFWREHRALNKLLKQIPFDLIISDNCYGLWNKRVRSIFITHQLNIQLPRSIKFLQPIVNSINHRLIRNFNECWVPDYNDDNGLSGILSHPAPKQINVNYIGPLSRFSYSPIKTNARPENRSKKLLCLISGPENQRSIFEKLLLKEAEKLSDSFNFEFIRGLPGKDNENLPEGWYNHLSSNELQNKILEADLIISRSGYSTIMDLFVLQKPAILIPTPGQTEQEYLALYLFEKGIFYYQEQEKLNIHEGIETMDRLSRKIGEFMGNISIISKLNF